jgi:hypothetical protein
LKRSSVAPSANDRITARIRTHAVRKLNRDTVGVQHEERAAERPGGG